MEAGTLVRLKSDPGRQGVLTGKKRSQAGIMKYQVAFPEAKSFYPEYEIEVLGNDDSDWFSLLEDGKFGKVRDLRRNLTHIHLSGRLANLVYSMDATNTDFYAYQYKPVLSFLDSPSNGLLIADEVGLGKTIEAGLIWTELRARYDARRLLVICPAMLREKWCSELNNRFGVDAEIMSADELLTHLQKNKYEIADGKGIVCSLQGLRPPSGWQDDESKRSSRAELARFIDEQSDNEPLIDLVIIDEAHYLRNPASQSAKLGQMLRNITDNIVLLSATPINLSDDDLFHLLNLVDPDSFGVKEVFPQVLSANEHLTKARDLALNKSASSEQIHEELVLAKQHPLLASSKQLKDLVTNQVEDDLIKTESERVQLANQIERINLLQNAITRTRKSEVMEWKVIREPVRIFVELDEEGPEWKFYKLVTETIRRYAWEMDVSDGFLLAGPQRQVSSCMVAAAEAWKSKIENYNELIYEDLGNDSEKEYEISPLIERLNREVMPQIDLSGLRANDSKYEQFRSTVLKYLEKHPEEKVIIFSFYRKTLTYLSERLFEDGIQSQVLFGGMKEKKQDVIERFRDTPKLRVLLSSEVASEGVDLQFSRVLINYDLPWNPMKVEQRIGRIDRLGQKAEKIQIINLLYADTIDHRIYERLYARLKIFERALGGMEAILGEEISHLTADLLSRPLTDEQVEKRIDQTAIAIENIRQHQIELENQASHLIAHGGYILEEVQASHQFKKRITESDLITYVKDYLCKYCQGFDFQQSTANDHAYEIRLSAKTAAQLNEFIRKKKLYGQTRLATGDKVKCLFSNKVRGVHNKEEAISQFHPLIRFISEELHKNNESFYPLVSVKITESESFFDKGEYAFFVNKWLFSGIKVEEELSVRIVNYQSGNILSRDDSWRLLNMARVHGQDWLEAGEIIDSEAFSNALEKCIHLLELDYQAVKLQRENENTDRVNFQIESVDRHKNRQLSTHKETLAKYLYSGRKQMIPAMEGRIRKVKERFEVQKERLLQKSQLKCSNEEVCCGVIKVV